MCSRYAVISAYQNWCKGEKTVIQLHGRGLIMWRWCYSLSNVLLGNLVSLAFMWMWNFTIGEIFHHLYHNSLPFTEFSGFASFHWCTAGGAIMLLRKSIECQEQKRWRRNKRYMCMQMHMKSSNAKASKSHLGQKWDNDTEWMLSTHSICSSTFTSNALNPSLNPFRSTSTYIETYT